MKKQPGVKLSIIILNYNTERLLEQCLASLPKRDDYQVIVVDNASTDGSVAMVEKKFSRIKLIRNAVNVGFTKGNNTAKESTFGEYVLFLNSDTKVYKQTLETMVTFMDRNPGAGISTCLTELPDGSLYYACHRGFPTPWNSLLYFLGLPSNYKGSFWPINTIHEIDACSGTFLLIRKDVLDKINWFDEDYFAFGEDIDMCYRTKQLGYKVMFVPTVKIMHYWGASGGLKSTSKDLSTAGKEVQHQWNSARYEAMRIFYDKHYRQKYPEIFRALVLGGINLANYLRRGRD